MQVEFISYGELLFLVYEFLHRSNILFHLLFNVHIIFINSIYEIEMIFFKQYLITYICIVIAILFMSADALFSEDDRKAMYGKAQFIDLQ